MSNPNIWLDDEYSTGLTFDHTKVANFIPAIKPESKEDKIAFINNFERRGGWYYPGRHAAGDTYALNVKLYGAVKIPDEFLAVTDTEWFYREWHDHDVEFVTSEFTEKHKGYSTCFAGRSGGYLILQYCNDSVDEPWVEEDTEEYEEVYERYNHYQEWWKRFMKLHLHDGHKRRLSHIVQVFQTNYGLIRRMTQLEFTAYDDVQNAIHSKDLVIMGKLTRYPRAKGGEKLFKRFFSTTDVLYNDVNKIGDELAPTLFTEIQSYEKEWARLNILARAMYQKKYGKDSIYAPDALLTWEDEDLDELFEVLWDFLVLAQSLAMSFAYKCFWDTCQAKLEEVVDTEEETS